MKILVCIISLFLLFAGSTAGFAKSKAIDASSAIETVTVFPGHANIERAFKGKFEKGIYTLKFSHLPTAIIDNSVRVSGKGAASAKILNVKVTKKILTEAFKKESRELEEQREKLVNEINGLIDSNIGLARRQEFLEKLTDKTAESISNKKNVEPPPLQNWEDTLVFLEKQLVDASAKKRDIENKIKKLMNRKRIFDEKLNDNLSARGKSEKTVFVDLEVTRRGNLNVIASYIIPGAKWAPFFDLRLDSSGKKANLTCSALVSQQTGEDWKNVALTFSTAQPLLVKQVPTLMPLHLGRPQSSYYSAYSSMANSDGYSGEIHGTLLLPDGSEIPGADVILNSDLYGTNRTVTSEEGRFVFRGLIPGAYDLKCELEGFKTVRSRGLLVYENKRTMLKVTMETSTIREEVVITAKTGVIDVRKTTHSYNFGSGSAPATGRVQSDPVPKKSSPPVVVKPKIDFAPKVQSVTEQTAALKKREHSFSLSFSIKHKETIASNKSAQKATMFIENYDVEFEHVAVPRLSNHTFLKATVKNNGETPLLGGKVNIFFDGTFVNTSRMNFVNPGDKFTLTVGADEAVTVKREPIKKKIDTKGMFRKKKKSHFGYTIDVKNFRRGPVKLRVIDQLPITDNKKIQVNPIVIQPEPLLAEEKQKRDKAKESGIMEWLLELAPGESQTIRVEYDVIHPKNIKVTEQGAIEPYD